LLSSPGMGVVYPTRMEADLHPVMFYLPQVLISYTFHMDVLVEVLLDWIVSLQTQMYSSISLENLAGK